MNSDIFLENRSLQLLLIFLVVTFVVVTLVVVSLVVVSLVVVTLVLITAIRLDLDGVGVDDVFLFLVTSGLGIVTGVNGVKVALGVVTITALVLAVIVVVVIVIHAPIEVVVGGVLPINQPFH